MPANPVIENLLRLKLDEVQDYNDRLDEFERRWILGPLFDWEATFAREPQREPLGDWRIWLIKAGRGAGKTRAGAEWVRKQVELGLAKRIALVGETASDVRDVMIEGESGILAVSPPWLFPKYEPSKRRLTWYNADGGVRAIATAYTAEKPNQTRGPQHDAAWCDELAAWRYKEAYDNLVLGLRVGPNPRCVITTTPKPTALLKELIAEPTTRVTEGSTYDNLANLAPAFIDYIRARYAGTSLERQEIFAELLEEAEGALWRREWIEKHRWNVATMGEHPDLDHLVVAIDPAGSTGESSSETGIMVVGRAPLTVDGETLPHFFVLDDLSGRYTPNAWANVAIEAYYEFDGDYVIGERNNGGDMVESNLMNSDDTVPIDTVWASRGKVPRAQPVANLYEQGRVHHVVGTGPEAKPKFRDLEDQLCQWEPGAGMPSPDRLDALVWGISYIMPTGREPQLVTGLDLSGGELGRKSAWREGE